MASKNESHRETRIAGPLTLGSLFDGIGVFPLVASWHGIVPRWASEIEKAPISITKRHFPHMEHLGDITKLDGGTIPAVHIITFGSPCQNLSKMGDRTGLAGAKSSLFYQAIRIIQEMRDATGDQFPIIFLPSSGLSGRTPKFQCLPLDDGDTPEWYEGDDPIWPGGPWMPNTGQAPAWHGGSASSSWRILEGGVLEKYCLSPACWRNTV